MLNMLLIDIHFVHGKSLDLGDKIYVYWSIHVHHHWEMKKRQIKTEIKFLNPYTAMIQKIETMRHTFLKEVIVES